MPRPLLDALGASRATDRDDAASDAPILRSTATGRFFEGPPVADPEVDGFRDQSGRFVGDAVADPLIGRDEDGRFTSLGRDRR